MSRWRRHARRVAAAPRSLVSGADGTGVDVWHLVRADQFAIAGPYNLRRSGHQTQSLVDRFFSIGLARVHQDLADGCCAFADSLLAAATFLAFYYFRRRAGAAAVFDPAL